MLDEIDALEETSNLKYHKTNVPECSDQSVILVNNLSVKWNAVSLWRTCW